MNFQVALTTKANEELIHWDISTGHDSYGTYQIITGFEGTDCCFWCGKDLEGRRRFCGQRSGCWTLYNNYFYWGFARYECLKRYDWHCANCGTEASDIPLSYLNWKADTAAQGTQLKVHHIIPLKGEARAMSPFNIYWNLMSFRPSP